MGLRAIAICLFLVACTQVEKVDLVRPVKAMQLEQQELVKLYSFPGRTRAVERVNLSFRVEGQLIERPTYVGQEVQKGDLLARLDPQDFEVSLKQARGQMERVEADLRFAERDYQRATNIWKEDPGAISESLLDQKEEERNRLRGQLKTWEAKVQAAEDQLEYTYLRSPFQGVVVSTYVENYEYVRAKQPIVRLLDSAKVEMVIDVPESMIADIPYVEKISVEFDSLPGREFPAKIKEVGTEASAITRTYPVTLLIDQKGKTEIFPGMAGHATLFSDRSREFSQEGFLIPTTALITDTSDESSYVWLVEEGVVHRKQVQTGKLTSDGIIITHGLSVGDWVVTAGVNSLEEGQEVTLFDGDT